MNLNNVETKITVDRKPCDFVKMELHQRMAGHHTFEITVNYRAKEKSVWSISIGELFRGMLGKSVGIVMKHTETEESNEFYGVVTDIDAVGIDGDQGTIVLKGGSPTILLDRDPAMAAFVDYNLHNVVAETVKNTGIKMELDNKPKLTRMIPYIARYKETGWAFLSRVLYSFGEWFYYDGLKLVVGNPQNIKSRRVTYDMELLEVHSASRLHNLNTIYYDYDPTENNYFEESSGTIHRVNSGMRNAKQTSDALYPTVSKLPVGREVLSEKDMTDVVRMRQSREYTKMSVFTASANTCGVRIGETAEAVLPQNLRDVKITGLGAFRVLEVHHHADSIGHYSNTFKGIVSQNETLPDDHIVVPTAFPEPATVVDNADPRHQGRVKVRYFWQAHDESTNWIRVQTPDAGKSDAVAKNRGMVFIPEVGDQVMVGFIQGDPSRPYVAGSLFHRDNSKGAAPDNNIKTISTRSGHTIEFNDDEKGSWGITVKDKKKNLLHIDTKDNNISVFANNNVTVTAVENMTLNAKNMLINVEEDMTTVVGGNMQTRVSGDVFLQGTNYEQYMSGDSKITNDGNLYQKSSEQVVLTDGDSVLKAKGKALMQGAQDARVSKG